MCPLADAHLLTIVAENLSVLIHQLSKHASQPPFKRTAGSVQRVAFHPNKPHFFAATKHYIKLYDLTGQQPVKTLQTGVRWISSMDIHPDGENVIMGSYDKKLCWFDLELGTKPYKTLRSVLHHCLVGGRADCRQISPAGSAISCVPPAIAAVRFVFRRRHDPHLPRLRANRDDGQPPHCPAQDPSGTQDYRWSRCSRGQVAPGEAMARQFRRRWRGSALVLVVSHLWSFITTRVASHAMVLHPNARLLGPGSVP